MFTTLGSQLICVDNLLASFIKYAIIFFMEIKTISEIASLGGKARWKKVSDKKKKEFMSMMGKKGGVASGAARRKLTKKKKSVVVI